MTDMPRDAASVEEAAEVDHDAVSGAVKGRDGGPQDDGDMRAADGLQASEGTAQAYEEILERGKNQKGEGRVG